MRSQQGAGGRLPQTTEMGKEKNKEEKKKKQNNGDAKNREGKERKRGRIDRKGNKKGKGREKWKERWRRGKKEGTILTVASPGLAMLAARLVTSIVPRGWSPVRFP